MTTTQEIVQEALTNEISRLKKEKEELLNTIGHITRRAYGAYVSIHNAKQDWKKDYVEPFLTDSIQEAYDLLDEAKQIASTAGIKF